MIGEPMFMEPEEKELDFYFGVGIPFVKFGVLYQNPSIDDIFPTLYCRSRADRKGHNYKFFLRENKSIIFAGFPLSDLLKQYRLGKVDIKDLWHMCPSISKETWLEALAFYHDYLAAVEIEKTASQSSSNSAYHVLLDQRNARGQMERRRLLYIFYSSFAARYFLRQHRFWQEHLWKRRSIYDSFWESVFAQEISKLSSVETASSAKVKVQVAFPNGSCSFRRL